MATSFLVFFQFALFKKNMNVVPDSRQRKGNATYESYNHVHFFALYDSRVVRIVVDLRRILKFSEECLGVSFGPALPADMNATLACITMPRKARRARLQGLHLRPLGLAPVCTSPGAAQSLFCFLTLRGICRCELCCSLAASYDGQSLRTGPGSKRSGCPAAAAASADVATWQRSQRAAML